MITSLIALLPKAVFSSLVIKLAPLLTAQLVIKRAVIVCLWGLLIVVQPAQAERYRYHDANRMVHYLDNHTFKIKPLPESGEEHAHNRNGVLMRIEERADGHYIWMLNRLNVAITLVPQFTQQHNVAIPVALQQALLLPASAETLIGKLAPKQAGDWHYQYGFSYLYGDQPAQNIQATVPNVHEPSVIEKTAAYFPPSQAPSLQNSSLNLSYRATQQRHVYYKSAHDLAAPVIGSYLIAQGFNGDFSHNKPATRYALDLALPVGTPLYASRAGVVVAAVDHHQGGGLDEKFRGKANHLRIRHSDGTVALYAHLKTGSIRVAKGEQVRLGQAIAASGNTGYTSGAHLHLALQVNKSGVMESIPFTLQGSQPIAGVWLTGNAWGAQ
ncbi:hypothetical protein CBP12_07590 [Oceanisphaera avium]|uniref:M23ase beta-sheet core domain-containing protein n=2 Tax=Oceanisphaera avium TaxID=1903694 RepID=A0A1Y0D0M5_9GAMM|nr:hypothetical protein CBP12_07590 [Oceanisphaera avium]